MGESSPLGLAPVDIFGGVLAGPEPSFLVFRLKGSCFLFSHELPQTAFVKSTRLNRSVTSIFKAFATFSSTSSEGLKWAVTSSRYWIDLRDKPDFSASSACEIPNFPRRSKVCHATQARGL